jgi:CelD/BcsL family acetyltransferase involved in cellulose biosynthesis
MPLADCSVEYTTALSDKAAVVLTPEITETPPDSVLRDWMRRVTQTTNHNALFQSPQWFDHLRAIEPKADASLLAVQTNRGVLGGVVPLAREFGELPFSIGRRIFFNARLRTVEVLGGPPLLDEELEIHDQFFATVETTFTDCDTIKITMLPTDSFCWRYLSDSAWIRKRFIVYVPDGATTSHLISLPNTFDDYLRRFSSGTRKNFKRHLRLLREHGSGVVALHRYETEDDVDKFVTDAVPVVRNSWQHKCASGLLDDSPHWRSKLLDLAGRQLLRSYVLKCGGEPCAAELGYQFGGVFHSVQTHYDRRLSKLSPGTMLLYSYLEDLTNHRPPSILSFGFGHSAHKEFFSDIHQENVSVLLVRRRIANRIKVTAHSTFRSCVSFVKARVK